MSGGHFDYKQYELDMIADSIQHELDKQGREIPEDMRWYNKEWYDEHPEDRFHTTYSSRVQEAMRTAVKKLREAAIYAQRIDWFLSGDDDEESFIRRLNEDLSKLSDNLRDS